MEVILKVNVWSDEDTPPKQGFDSRRNQPQTHAPNRGLEADAVGLALDGEPAPLVSAQLSSKREPTPVFLRIDAI